MAETYLEVQVGESLLARGLKVCSAESCTGGLVMHRLTNVPGSSSYVLGGIVAYANEAKMALLGVQLLTLETYGAVSAETAEEMARGALNRFNADVAVSVTGIAGPSGGSIDKPVGLTYLSVVTRTGLQHVERHLWSGDREAIKSQSADAALRTILSVIQES
ncbi:MAG: nicotinamide-nucleotide amidohydrolase family protein [Anaerolineae bacterium]|nr:nicotinamide-nucleotide amidohydrolase family protein [Anaerolineae bacterium]